MAYVVAVFDDLRLGAHVLGTVRAAGHEAELVSPARAKPYGADVVIVGDADITRLREDAPAARFVGLHPDCDLVVTRSRIARDAPALVAAALGT